MSLERRVREKAKNSHEMAKRCRRDLNQIRERIRAHMESFHLEQAKYSSVFRLNIATWQVHFQDLLSGNVKKSFLVRITKSCPYNPQVQIFRLSERRSKSCSVVAPVQILLCGKRNPTPSL